MTCAQATELIGPYVDDDLPAEARRRVESHLMTCAACAWEAQTQRITREALRESGEEVVASDAFRARALSCLRRDNPHLTYAPETEPADATQYRLPINI